MKLLDLFLTNVAGKRGPVYPCPHDGDGNNKSAKTQPTTHVLELTECHDSEISYKFIRCKNHIPITFGILEILDISRQLGNPCNITCSCRNSKVFPN